MSCKSWWWRGDGNLTGTPGNDWLIGGRGDNTIDGLGGNDFIWAGRGDDSVDGGDGHDWIWSGRGDDTVNGGHGNDRISAGRGDDQIDGGYGNDRIYAGRGDDGIDGGDGHDYIRAGRGDDHIVAGAGNDRVRGERGDDYIDGGEGDDNLRGGRGDDEIHGGADNDHIRGGRGDDYIDGGEGDDNLRGGRGDDEIHGGADNDHIRGGRGDDHVNGGSGDDCVYGGRGDDTGVYSVSENRGSKDYYHGGRGNDVLILEMTHAEYAAAKADMDAFDFYLAQARNGWHHSAYQFDAFDLKVKGWERYEVRLTDSETVNTNAAPQAADDSVYVTTDVVPIPEVEPNDPDGQPWNETAQVIERSSFRTAPSPDVGDDSLPRVSITGTISGPLPVTGPNATDVDLFAITLMAGEKLILDIDDAFSSENPINAQLFVMDESGNVLAQNDNSLPSNGGGGSFSFFDPYLEFTDPGTGGTYYVAVSTYNNDPIAPGGEFNNLGFAPGDYTLNVSIDNPAPDLGAFVIAADSLLANDWDENGDPLSIVGVGNAVNGEVELTGTGEILFKAASNAPGSFEYTVSDGNGEQSTATVTVNGNAVTGTPLDDVLTGTAENDLFVGGEGSDTFNFATGSGTDTVADFEVGTDTLAITDGMMVTGTEQLGNDTLVNFDTGDSVLLVGVSGVTDVNDLLS